MVEILALIPARGGSKSIPRKNIRPFAGYPLIAYSIASGLAAETVRRVVVSTDDEEIAAIARGYGAETPFLRPVELSQDHTPDLPVFQHALRWLAEHEGYQPEIVVQLRPTSPFRRVRHVDEAVRILAKHPEADSARTVCIPFQNPFKMWRIDSDGFMRPLIADVEMVISTTGEGAHTDEGTHAGEGAHTGAPLRMEPYNMPRQALPDVYWQTGYVDAAWASTILSKDSMTGERILPLVIDPSEWIDIDSPDDWRRAERLLESGEITFEDLGFSIEIR